MNGWDWAFWAAGAWAGLGGLILAAWAIFRDRARGRRRCPRCWYDMGGVPGLTCPECGREARSERALGRTKPRWRWAAAGLLLVGIGAATAAIPAVQSGRWVNYPPVWLLNVAISPFDDRAKTEYEQRWLGMGGGWSGLRRSQRASASMPAATVGIQVSGFNLSTPATTQWQRLLAARRCQVLIAQGLASMNGTDPYDSRPLDVQMSDALGALPSLRDEARLTLPAVRRALASRFPTLRHQAGPAVSSSSTLSTALIPFLARLARSDDDDGVRRTAVETLGGIGPGAKAAATILRAALRQDRSAEVRLAAAEALLAIDPAAPELLPALESALQDTDAAVRLKVIEMLASLARGGRNWVGSRGQIFGGSLPHVPGPSEQQQVVASAYPGTVPILCAAIDDPDPSVRLAAVEAVGWFRDSGVVPALERRWTVETDDSVQLVIVRSLWLQRRAERLLPQLIQLVERSPDTHVIWACQALGMLGESAIPAAPALEHAARVRSITPANAAVDALGRLGPAATPQLMSLLSEGSAPIKRRVVLMVGSGHWQSPSQCAGLIKALGDADPYVRRWVLQALPASCTTDDGEACRRAADLLRTDPDYMVRRACAEALAELKPPCRSAGEALAAAMDDQSVLVRHAAATTLAALWSAGRKEESRAGLERARQDQDAAVRAIAERALQHADERPPEPAKPGEGGR